ncbi:hypothetical protein F1721_09895 [Saccharopolyspora hirsuta]|uniref:Thiopeptide-type bacteriocin biosynthesis domain-containing protein n=1 Tax=Saccharopolyspora hirsuta TaxID=1837 RepID=A0A5M7C0Z7_SACHI|nr:hypothetical protein [Saccharopolyspora hirsuta]KAA5835100.1 hypothetical protein F1721_09895 [Saccharopolyspora hirsuta]
MHETQTPEQESTTEELVPALHGLVTRIRAADARSRWFFERHDRIEPVLALWSRTTGDARAEAAREVAAEHQRIRIHPGDFDADPAALSGTALGLAEAASELALQVLRDGGLPATRQVPFAALHLHRLIGHVAAPKRAAFLFQCWQSWSAALEPDQRVALLQQADRHLDDVLAAVPAEEAGSAWSQYLKSVDALVAATTASESPPLNYLLFDHARRTHLRLGVPEPVQALAARTLRTALRAGLDDRAPAPEPGRTELALEGARP